MSGAVAPESARPEGRQPGPAQATRSAALDQRRPSGVAFRWALVVSLGVAAGAVFGRWAFAPPQAPEVAGTPAAVTVAEITVGRSVPLAVSAVWRVEPLGVGAASGTLTSLEVTDGAVVEAGQRLYTVDLRPVVAGSGPVPAFRDLSRGAEGADVAQLQQLLVDQGFLSGEIDGKFGAATNGAVKAWQRSIGVAPDGVVRAGDLVFATALPSRVRVAEDVRIGDRLSQGQVVLSVLVGDPEFRATAQNADEADPSLPVEVTFDGTVLAATVSQVRRDGPGGSTIFVLTRLDGSSVCAGRCDQVPLDEDKAVYPARQVVTPAVTGPGVPAAAVWFDPAGDAYLVTVDGARVPVTIRGQGQGQVVVDGVEVGTIVVLAGEPSDGVAGTGG